jgi:hypothetical protein
MILLKEVQHFLSTNCYIQSNNSTVRDILYMKLTC